MIHIHTDELLAAVSSLRAANGEVSNATSHLMQITNHNDWSCKERYQINENIDRLHAEITRLQQDTETYLAAAAEAADAFVTEENAIKALFPGVDVIIGKVLSIGGTEVESGSSGIDHGGSGRIIDSAFQGVDPHTIGGLLNSIHPGNEWVRPDWINPDNGPVAVTAWDPEGIRHIIDGWQKPPVDWASIVPGARSYAAEAVGDFSTMDGIMDSLHTMVGPPLVSLADLTFLTKGG